jgi:murein DD-endopeptidase MepM/ murein hydrolase activator NlpD
VSTYEPFGPPYSGAVHSAPVVGEADTLEEDADLEIHDETSECTPEEVASGACENDETDGGDLEEVSAESLQKTGALHRLAEAVRKVGKLFRPKSKNTEIAPEDEYLQELLTMNLEIPVEGVSTEQLRDSFLNPRGGRRRHREHLALDIGAPRGTPILAVADGEVARVAREKRGGKCIYLRDSSNRYLFYYCHLSGYQKGLRTGMKVKKGDRLGFVGATGNAHGAHLHFSVTRLPDDNFDFRRGLAVNPYLVYLFGVKPIGS